MIIRNIPEKAKFRPTANVFSAAFAGVYDFNIAGNQKQKLFDLVPNTVYLLNEFSFAGNIGAEEYLSSLDLLNLPYISISKKHDQQKVYDTPIFLPSFLETREAAAFLKSNQQNDEAQISIAGILKQISTTVGLSPMILTVSFSVYYMDENEYNRAFADSNHKVY